MSLILIPKNNRGFIYERKENNDLGLYAATFEKVTDYTTEDVKENRIEYDINSCTFLPAYDGTIIRVFNHNGVWHISTNRRINASNSRWAHSTNFGKLFTDNIDFNIDDLDTDNVYFYLLRASGPNCIWPPEQEATKPIFLGTMPLRSQEFTLNPDLQVLDIKSWQDLVPILENPNAPNYEQGVVFYTGGKFYKIYRSQYKDIMDLRGNIPSIVDRYLQVRLDEHLYEKMRTIYSSYVAIFNKIEDDIFNIALDIKGHYDRKFRNKTESIRYPDKYKYVISELHGWHLKDRRKNQVHRDAIIDYLNSLKPDKLKFILGKLRE